jgi:hypothetical protein
VVIATPGTERTLQTYRRVALTDAVPITEIDGRRSPFLHPVLRRPGGCRSDANLEREARNAGLYKSRNFYEQIQNCHFRTLEMG